MLKVHILLAWSYLHMLSDISLKNSVQAGIVIPYIANQNCIVGWSNEYNLAVITGGALLEEDVLVITAFFSFKVFVGFARGAGALYSSFQQKYWQLDPLFEQEKYSLPREFSDEEVLTIAKRLHQQLMY